MSKPAPTSDPRMAGLPAEAVGRLQAAARAIRDGAGDRAQALLQEVLAERPEHPEALRVQGILLNGLSRWAEAITVLQRALAQRPEDALILSSLGTALTGAGRSDEGIAAWREACALDPGDAMLWFNLGRNLQQAGRTAEAEEALAQAVALEPRAIPAQVLLADARVHLGRFAEAREGYRAALRRLPWCGDAWRGLSNLKTFPLEDAELDALSRLIAEPRAEPLDRISMAFALGKALEDRRRYAEAFAAIETANARTRELGAWDAAAFSAHVDRVIATAQALTAAAPPGLGAEVIFVVSLPRSGSTLVEQMLASHPQVEGASELTDLEDVLQAESLRRKAPFPRWVPEATADDWARLGRAYLERTARWRRARPLHTDKMPDNWLYAGVLRAMLPGARVVDVRRDPLEVGWSCFKQQFYRVPHFSNALPHLAAYLGDHDRAMDAFSQSSGQIRVQHYERLIADPEGEVRALLAFCGLPFDPACLAFHRSERSVRTASAAQVREPLRSDTARSARYGALLNPLRAALGLPPFEDAARARAETPA